MQQGRYARGTHRKQFSKPTVQGILSVSALSSISGVIQPDISNIPLQVKVMPGTAKKGKATKTALSMFIGERGTSQREKELLKSVKDVDLARGAIQ